MTKKIILAAIAVVWVLAATASRGGAQGAAIAKVPGINATCTVPAGDQPWMVTTQTPTCRALEALAVMTQDEKLAFRGSLARLGLVNGGGSDGPQGIAGAAGRGGAPPAPRSLGVTLLPSEHILAATWDRSLAKRFGQTLGEEVNGKSNNVMISPTIVLMRGWHWGRAAESFGEDQYLTAEMLVPELLEIQGHKIISVLKHYVVDGQEMFRPRVSATVSERALQEVYLPPWKAAVQRAGLGAVFCESNRTNGLNPCEDPDMLGRMRAWGFDGYIRPEPGFDPIKAITAGTDEIPGAAFASAIQAGQATTAQLDLTVMHHLLPNFRLGIYDAPGSGKLENMVSTPAHQQLAVEVGTAGTVLLKNKGNVLPLDAARVKSIAIIGDDAGPNTMIQATNQSVYVEHFVTPLDGITKRAGTAMKVTYAKGTTGITAVLPPIGGLQGQGFSATFWPTEDFTGAPAGTKFDSTIDVTGAPLPSLQPPAPPAPPAPMAPPAGAPGGRGGGGGRGPAGPRVAFSARWEGTLTPATTGVYRYAIGGAGVSELRVDGKLIATARAGATNPFQGAIDLVAGKPVALRVDYTTRGGNAPQVRLGWQAPDAAMNAETDNAAKSADVALVFVGERLGEGSDKPVFNLPADQDALIDRVATANPRTIVVLNAPTAVAMPWIDKVAGVVYAGYAGQFSGDIIAKVLFGDVNPSGKLPITFPVDASQGPGGTPASYPGLDGLTVARDEGILLGYKYYDAKNQAPLFPFGFGLSYTTFTYGPLKLSTTGATRTASIPVTNSGTRDGAEIVQLYLSYPAAADEPPRVLKGFDKVALKSKETKTVSIPIDAEALSVWDEASKAWKTFPGTYTVSIGASSRDIKGKGTFAVTN